ncbi:LRR receptor-like serine/threonine-protein kinase EFR [Olea europaea var. sylvestris]|uniref:LRR receptor-like serine/threonine-protein kinase EFR n=1 Tax=Olea europaea var. sylvestris TaxID=158386 RepID=UPI000C1D33C0|nr:LRR receptor-like serine/threonine-protein kinase EFR [Olea europaea var. sylvestris]
MGIIPDGMGNLSVLYALDLRFNNLTGNIPHSFGKMSHLKSFTIRNNNIQGQIPPELGHLLNLKEIIFSSNKLEGEIPESIFNLSKLQLLALVDNDISGTLPSSIAYCLPDLEYLYLAINRISGDIPHYISNFSKLAKLELGNNSFSGSVPMNLGNLQNLRYLSIAYNKLTNDPSVQELDFLISLNNCKMLKTIQIGYNYFDGMLPKAVGNMSTSLEKFYAPSCGIKGLIPSEIGNLSNLIWLEMGGNELTGKIPDTLSQLKKVQKLSLNDNKLGGTIPVNLCGLVNMYHLDLGNNNLSTHLPTCLGDLTSLQELNLSYNSLSSTVPSKLWTNREIQIMDLSYNLFFGTLALEIGSAKEMRELHLSGNQFSGWIPSTVGKLQGLEILTLSNNQLYGLIPDSFANLIAMQSLDLSKNNLYGVIPKSMEKLKDLVYFNVSFNELSGEIPNEGPFKNLTAYSFMGNDELCGASQFKVKPCKGNTSKSSSKTKFLKYILPPSALAAGLVIIMVWLLSRHNRNATLRDQSSFPITIKRISYFDILRSTNNFDEENLISRGSISSVYKGIFSDGMIAAIKVFNLDMEGTNKSFDTECNLLCNIRHRNVVKVISSCCNLDLKALVLEYMPKGNLNSWLYSYDYCLNMAERLEIMTNVASGLEYLHHGYPSPIVHCDLKPSNILLDEDMVAHVGDFGISKLFAQDQRISQTNTLGTIGYMAPEYGSMGIISTMADVYSYGIVLMETFTKKKPTDDIFVGELTMRRWVLELHQNAIMQIMDVDLVDGVEENIKSKEICFKSIMRLALQCTTNLPEERLNIEYVLIRLKKIKVEFLSNSIGEQYNKRSITN